MKLTLSFKRLIVTTQKYTFFVSISQLRLFYFQANGVAKCFWKLYAPEKIEVYDFGQSYMIGRKDPGCRKN